MKAFQTQMRTMRTGKERGVAIMEIAIWSSSRYRLEFISVVDMSVVRLSLSLVRLLFDSDRSRTCFRSRQSDENLGHERMGVDMVEHKTCVNPSSGL
jgi:hypothetical protein